MDARTSENRYEGRERRQALRRASDRELIAELNRRTGRCAEIGCNEKAWHGSEYCIWHPRLKLAVVRCV